MASEGLNFRNTAAPASFPGDPANTTYVIAGDDTGTTDVTRGGITFRPIQHGATFLKSDISGPTDGRFCGYWAVDNTTTGYVKLVVPHGSSQLIRMAMGVTVDISTWPQKCVIYDGDPDGAGTVVTTIFTGTGPTANHYIDATGVIRTSVADWVANNAAVTHTFTGDCYFVFGGYTPASQYTLWANVSVTDATSTTHLTSVTPNAGNPGTTLSAVALVGTGFVTGMTCSVSGTGVTASAVTVSSTTNATVDLTITIGATPGDRNLKVTLAGVDSDNTLTFTVNTSPTITTAVNHTSGVAQVNTNTTNTQIDVVGTGIASAGLAATITPAANCTIHAVSFTSATAMTFQLDVASGAAEGNRTIAISQTVGGVSNSVAFLIGAAPATTGGGGISASGSGAIKA